MKFKLLHKNLFWLFFLIVPVRECIRPEHSASSTSLIGDSETQSINLCIFLSRYTAALVLTNCIKERTLICRRSINDAVIFIYLLRPIIQMWESYSFTMQSLSDSIKDIIPTLSLQRRHGSEYENEVDQDTMRDIYIVLYWLAVDIERPCHRTFALQCYHRLHFYQYAQIMYEPPTFSMGDAYPEILLDLE